MEDLIKNETIEKFTYDKEEVLSFSNIHGEEIRVKSKDGKIYVHHDDCTDDYVTLEELIFKFHLEPVEWLSVLKAAKMTMYKKAILNLGLKIEKK
jgi:hypothetical protein